MRSRKTYYPGDAHFKQLAIGVYGGACFDCAMHYALERRTFIDVGAHIGHWTYNAVGKFKTVIAIEPQRANFECLVRNMNARVKKLKRKPKCMMMNVGCASRSQTMDVYPHNPSGTQNSGAWEFSTKPVDGIEKESVNFVALDDLDVKDVDFIKIDVQGWEREVLAGARKLIERDRPILIVEAVLNGRLDMGLTAIVRGMGYEMQAQVGKDIIFVEAHEASGRLQEAA